MKDQLKTIRSAIEMATPHYQADTERFKQALAALSELEAMAGEPVAKLHDDGYWTPMKTDAGRALNERLMRAGSPSIEVYTAAPPAQQPQYEAGDMASAHNDGFRAGVASVAQRPQAESLESLLSTAVGLLMGYEDRDGKGGTRNPYKPGSVVAKFVAECVERLKDWPMTAAPQQAEAVPVWEHIDGVRLEAAPQPLEAVPSDVVRDAERLRGLHRMTCLIGKPAGDAYQRAMEAEMEKVYEALCGDLSKSTIEQYRQVLDAGLDAAAMAQGEKP